MGADVKNLIAVNRIESKVAIIKFVLLNATSVKNKTVELNRYVTDNSIDFQRLGWLGPARLLFLLNSIRLLMSVPLSSQEGGGVWSLALQH